ncbi:serine/threonine-protein kinase [Microvirga sp. P5_D2]
MAELTAPLLQPGQVILNKYEVLRFLGRGHFGQVFQVFNQNLQQVSALKVILVENPESHKAVVEAQAMSLCGHDHVVRIITADVFDGSVLIEMEYIEGGSLGDRLLREFVPVVDAVTYVKQILFALEQAHAKGFVHRDVKPGNIMLAPRAAKLSDFGTAIHTPTGIRVMDGFYRPHASPEAVNGYEFSPRSDVYAAGLTLLRAVNNMAGWGHAWRDDVSFTRDIANGDVPGRIGHREWVPRGLKLILNRACSKHPDRRYQSAADFRQALEGLRLTRAWIRTSQDEWTCKFEGRAEILRYVPGRRHSVEYLVAGRRRTEHSSTWDTERDARLALERTVAALTLLPTRSKQGGGRGKRMPQKTGPALLPDHGL